MMRYGGVLARLAAIAMLAVALGSGVSRAADDADPTDLTPVPVGAASAETLGYRSLTILATDEGFVLPAEIPAGRYFETTRNVGTSWSHFFTLRVPDEVTDAQLAADMATEEDPSWLFEAPVVGNADQTLPGNDAHAVVDLAAGRYVLIDPIRGLVGGLTVAENPSAATPKDPASDFDVAMTEMHFDGLAETVEAGRKIWQVTNVGAEWHEIVVIALPGGTTAEGILPYLGSVPFDQFPTLLVGGSAVVSPGLTTWMVLDLEPGTYAAICTFPGESGEIHAAEGMYALFTVA